jgi:mono/diheme cytochrome c family protein
MRIRLAALGIVLAAVSVTATAAQAPDFSSYTGAELFKRFCSACHGAKAEGDGPVAASFKIMVPDLTRIAKRQGGTFPDERIHRIIDGRQVPAPHGSREMPIWGWEFATEGKDGTPDLATSDLLVAKLVDYLRSIQKP